SMAIQLAKQLAKLHVVGTASRPESIAWIKKLGADQVVNHRNALDKELTAVALPQVDYIFCLNNTAQHWAAMANAIAPQGRICSIVETPDPVDLDVLKSKSATFVWEFMFTRSMYQTADIIEQQRLLTSIATLIDEGKLVTTVNDVMRPINAANLRKAHALVEQGSSIGKIVLADWA
ncbi:MAG: zinc-binding dehydrogenase, partial [Nitrospirota bacterium]